MQIKCSLYLEFMRAKKWLKIQKIYWESDTCVQPICFKFSAGFLYSNSIIDHISEAGSPLKIYTVLKPPKGISTWNF